MNENAHYMFYYLITFINDYKIIIIILIVFENITIMCINRTELYFASTPTSLKFLFMIYYNHSRTYCRSYQLYFKESSSI